MNAIWNQCSKELKAALQNINLEGKPAELYEPIAYFLSLGGKRVRPMLCLISNQLFGGELPKAMPSALGLEIFHNFTLVHDDIMDQAPLRRGHVTVHEKWNQDIAILSGDVMFVKAYEQITQSEPEKLPELLKLFNQTAIQVCEGQQMDMNFEESSEVSLQDYLQMIELKTAVLLAAALKLGAITANANQKDADLIYEFGRNIGIAFQIQDDYLDAYADPEKFGKQVGGDILQNKKTYLLLSAFEKSDATQKAQLEALLSGNLKGEEKISAFIELFNQLNVPQHAQSAMQTYFDTGMQALNKIQEVKPEAKKGLVDLAEVLMGREV
tara:strand:- start:353 stop:1330 length:978 start_codon:yes stop_codon:yes gene_type:complete